jgi:LmbE family N-acetylglucosaminyl deacetylase
MRRATRFLFPIAAAAALTAADRLPEDRGAAGLDQAIRKLKTTARVLSVTAHPDDEDAGTLTYISRGLGAELTMLILNRGESGANLVSGDFFEGLGALRTGEMLKAAAHYGASVRFTRSVDFGFSKTMDETFRNWNREDVLRDCVRIVRQVRPHVIVSRFQGTARDGHGNHQAAGLLAQLMFDAAADGARFPEAGPAWKTQKLYLGGYRENEAWTIAVDSGIYDPVLGRSYAQLGREGYRCHKSQGMALSQAKPGPSVSYYRLAKSAVELAAKEKSFFERLSLRPSPQIEAAAEAALQAGLSGAAPHLAIALKAARASGDAGMERRALDALTLALGIELDATVDADNPPAGPFAGFRAVPTLSVVTPGAKWSATVTPHVRGSEPVTVLDRGIRGSAERPTVAYWRRDSVQQSAYQLDTEELFGLPLPPAPFTGWARFRYRDVEFELSAPVEASLVDPIAGQSRRTLAVGPPVSVAFSSGAGTLPIGAKQYRVAVNVRNFRNGPLNGALRLRLPGGWTCSPSTVPLSFERELDEMRVAFELYPPSNATGTTIEAIVQTDGASYRSSFQPIGQPGTETVYLSAPARHQIRAVDVAVARGLRVGYVMGTGDSVPSGLDQLGVPYDLLDAAAIASGDLSRYGTILLGIRAYAARNELKTYNARLLDYVAKGGVLVVQYNTQEFDSNYGPYSYQMTNRAEEISEEDAPVEILDPTDPVFQTPNRIARADFEGWVEQRGSKFLSVWDSRYKPLVSSADTGQSPQRGGWLVAKHGQGLYVYCAYAWYRQIPYAVPGAMRIFANLVSLGAADAPWRAR